VQKNDDELCFMGAAEAVALFKSRALSPVELMSAIIRRSERVNPSINCFADRYFEEALDRARTAEARYMRKSSRLGKLEGVPLAVKDAQRVAGRRTTYGSLIFAEGRDAASDPMVERLERAGAIVFARTTTPEFCLPGVTHSRMWGITRNPWNSAFTPGGSSGGSAAALAAGLTTLATGTDIGGSIRIPASACGIVGYKPPHGRNPDGPPAAYDRYNHCGPMTRSVGDAALMQSVTAGPHPLDHDSLKGRLKLPESAGDVSKLKVAYSVDFGYVEVEPQVRRNMLNAITVFRDLGATVTEVDLGWTSDVDKDCTYWHRAMDYGRQALWLSEHAELMTDYARRTIGAAASLSADDIHKSWARAHIMYQSLGPVLAAHDVFICPTNNVAAVKADHDPWDERFTVNGKPADPEYGWVMTHQFNMLHNLPVMSLPSGFTSEGIPTGIQIVARPWDDGRVFRAALAFEKASGHWYRNAAARPAI
jgi:amidase